MFLLILNSHIYPRYTNASRRTYYTYFIYTGHTVLNDLIITFGQIMLIIFFMTSEIIRNQLSNQMYCFSCNVHLWYLIVFWLSPIPVYTWEINNLTDWCVGNYLTVTGSRFDTLVLLCTLRKVKQIVLNWYIDNVTV